jgi:hypothetical protein
VGAPVKVARVRLSTRNFSHALTAEAKKILENLCGRRAKTKNPCLPALVANFSLVQLAGTFPHMVMIWPVAKL